LCSLVLALAPGCGDEASGGATSPAGTSASSGSAGAGSGGDASGGTGGSATSTGPGGSSSGGAGGGPPTGKVPMFVAQGHVARTAISCDDGNTWIEDQSDDDAVVCFSNDFDCDHHSGAANGITWGDGWFFATYGWGQPGSVRRSRDGIAWEAVLTDTTFGGMAHGFDTVLAGSRNPRSSVDDGANWTDLGDVDLDVWNVREVAFAPHDGGRFLLVGSDGGTEDIAVSDDAGQTWWAPTSLPAPCGISFYASGGTAYGNGAILIADGGDIACRSLDGGESWEVVSLPSSFESHLLWTGTEFAAWSQGQMLTSPDGVSWSTTPTTPANLQIGPVAMSDAGTFVAVRGGWNTWYDDQRFYRSTDGVTWTELPPPDAPGGHPIRDIQFGWAEPSASCPSN
jgi:hypothetical protein